MQNAIFLDIKQPLVNCVVYLAVISTPPFSLLFYHPVK